MTSKNDSNTRAIHARILLVEDVAADAVTLQRAFTSQTPLMTLTLVDSLQEAQVQLKNFGFELVILNLNLCGSQRDEDCLTLLRDNQPATSPTIVMIDAENESTLGEKLSSESLNYVVKSDTALMTMPNTAQQVLKQWNHFAERQRAENRLRHKDE